MTINQNILLSSFLFLYAINSSLFISSTWLYLVSYLIVCILMLSLYNKSTNKADIDPRKSIIKTIFLTILGVAGAIGVQLVAITLFPNKFVEVQSLNLSIGLVIPILLNPVMEELLFRYSLPTFFAQRYSFFLSSVLSAMLFSLLHGSNFFMYTSIGLLFSFLYSYTGYLWSPILAHILMNAIIIFIKIN